MTSSGELRAGVGSADITPDLPVRLAGYFDRRGEATVVRDALEAHAVVIGVVGTRLCLVTLDLMAMSHDVSTRIRDSVATALGVERAAVLTSCVHTHAAPSAISGTDPLGWPVPAGYPDLLSARAVDAARRAVEAAEPVTAAFARVALPPDLAVNRRGHALAPEAAVLDLRHVADGMRAAVIANFALHPTISGPENLAVSTDWVGPFRRARLTARTGAPTVFLQGCQGDVNPANEYRDSGDPAAWAPIVDDTGERLAQVVARGLEMVEPLEVSAASGFARSVTVPVGDTQLAALAGSQSTRTMELVEWNLGELALVAVPGEGFHAVERAVLAARGERVLIAGLAPDWNGYFPLPFTDGYEESLSYGADAVAAVIDELTLATTS